MKLKHDITRMFTNGYSLGESTEPTHKKEYHEMYGIVSIVIDELIERGIEIKGDEENPNARQEEEK